MDKLLLYKALKNKSGAEISASGNPVTLSGTLADNPLEDCKIYGWSKQDGDPTPENPVEIESAGMKWSTGKNLFSGFVFGGTTTKNENGITTTKEGASYIRSDHIPCEVGKHYVYNIPKGWRRSQTVFCNSDKKYIGTPKLPQSFNVPEDTAYFAFQIAKTDSTPIYQADLEAVSKLVQAEQADVCTEYEPYTGGIPKLYGDKIDVEVRGKNLFDFSRLVSDGVNVMNYDNQTITIPARTNNTGYNQTLRDLCPGITPGTYVLSLKRSNQESITGSYFLEIGKDFPVNTPIELTDVHLDSHISWYNNPDSKIENVISEIQIEKGNAVTSYEPYHEPQSLSIQTPTGLPAIPVDSGGNYTDADGQQWIADYIDLKRGKYVQNIRILELTGQEPYIVAGTSYFSGSSANMYIIASDMLKDGAVMCNCLSKKPYVWSIKSAVGCTTNIQQIHLRLPKATIGVNDDAGLEETKTAYKNYIKRCYEEGKPIEINYILAEPIERNLTPSEIQAYQELTTYAGTTIVENNAECYMEVSAGGGDTLRTKKLALLLGD